MTNTAIDKARAAKQALRERPSVTLVCRKGVHGQVEVWATDPVGWCPCGRLVRVANPT
jgi:hypothetical protein